MELNWNSPATTKAWLQGYLGQSVWRLYDFGDAAGCPPTGDCSTGKFSPDWTQYDVWYIAWGAGPLYKGITNFVQPIPLIYENSGAHARQWANLTLYSTVSQNKDMTIAGTMTQYASCQQSSCPPTLDNTPEQGWLQLLLELGKDTRTAQDLLWSTDIRYTNP